MPLYTELPRRRGPRNRAFGIPFFWESLSKQRAGTTTPAPALVCYFVCYVSRDLPVAEAPVIVVEALAILAEVVIVMVAVAVFVEVYVLEIYVYVVQNKDRLVAEVVLLNRVTEDASRNPDALREARATPLVVRCRPLS